MFKIRKKVLYIIIPLFMILVGVVCYIYDKSLRTIKVCGSVLPITCEVCRCDKGYRTPSHLIPPGGGSKANWCLTGKVVDCKTINP